MTKKHLIDNLLKNNIEIINLLDNYSEKFSNLVLKLEKEKTENTGL